MGSSDQSSPSGALAQSIPVPIAQLSPALENAGERSVNAVVTLVWPFSSSSRSLSLLLAEPDFRLRRTNGQVKATFHGFCAEEVARTQVGIGDKVALSLNGVEWTDNEAAKTTPGRGIAWDLHFKNRVAIEIARDSQHLATVTVDRPAPPGEEKEATLAAPATPAPVRIAAEEDGVFAESNKWASPAFLRSTRSSLGPLADSAFDPFAEQDGYIPGRGRKRPRFSMRSNEWRLVDEPASPSEYQSAWNQTEELEMEDEEQEEPEATEQEIEKMDMANSVEPNLHMKETTTPELATDKEDIAPPTELVEGPIPAGAEIPDSAKVTKNFGAEHPVEHAEQKFEEPAHQHLQPDAAEIVTPEIVTSHDTVDRQIATDHISRPPTDTPRLLPLPSPGLPIPSPLMTTPPAPHGYFPGAPTAEQNQNITLCSTSRPEDIATTEEVAVSEEQTYGVPHQAAERVPADPGKDAASMEADVRDSARLETELGAASQVSGFTATNERLKTPSNIQLEGPSVSVVSTEVHGYDVASEKAAETLEGLQKEEERKEDEENKEVEEEVEEMERELEEADDDDVEEVEREREEIEEEVKEMEEELSEDEEMEEDEQQEEDEEDEEDEEEMPACQMPSVSEEPTERAKVVIIEDDAEEQIEEPKEKEEELRERDDEDSEYKGEMPTRRDHPSDISEDEDEEEDQDEGLGAEEEYDDEYDSEQVHDEEYDGYPESESESDGENYPTRPQGPPPQRTVHPEVIVLDSDSDDEPPEATQAPQPIQLEKDSVSPRREPQILEQEAQLLESEVSDEEADEGDEDEDLSDDYKQREEIVESETEDITEGKLDREPERVELEHGDQVNVSEAKGEEPRGLVSRSRSLSSASTEDEAHLHQQRTSQSREPAIDPELLQAGAFSAGVPSGEDREGSEDYHMEDQSSQSQPLSDRDRQVEPGLLFDGARSPRPDNQTQSHLLLKPRNPIITPNASQGPDIGPERPTTHTAAETSIPTPRETQEVAIEPSLEAPTQSFELASFAGTEDAQRNIPRQESIPSEFQQHTVSSEIPPARLETPESTSVPEEEEPQTKKRPDDQESTEGEVEVVLQDQSLLQSDGTETPGLPPSQPNRHANGLRSRLSYFAPLATLIDHFNVLTDTISVVIETSPPVHARNSPREYLLTLQLTDPSMAGTTLPAQIFRPFKSVLPSAKEGDVILLRNFKVKSFNHSMTLLSSESSAWAVFHGEGDDAVVSGPPIEYGAEERAYAKGLQEWYREDGAAMVADRRLQLSVDRDNMDATPSSSAPPSEAGSIDSGMRAESTASARSSRRGRRSHRRRITIHELRDGTRYMEVGSPSDKESIHELRDGTIYANL
ncbi:hypothetical protein VTN02DRAFT_4173 [Thermoascus thermophilus]